MFRKLILLRWWFTLCHFAVPAAAFMFAGYVRFLTNLFERGDVDFYSYVGLIVILTIVWAFISEHYGLLNLPFRGWGFTETAKAALFTTSVVLMLAFFYRDTTFSRLLAVVGCTLMFIGALALRYGFRLVLRSSRFAAAVRVRVAIVGPAEDTQRLAEKIKAGSALDTEIAARIALPGKPSTSPDVLLWERAVGHVHHLACDELLVLLPPSRLGELEGLIPELQKLGLPMRLVLEFGEGILAREQIADYAGVPVVNLHPYPVDTAKYAIAKRAFDVAFSVPALLFFGPFMLLISLLIKLTSRGPVLFRQERVGLNGKRFTMLKFRSMRVQGDGGSDTKHTQVGDPRVTPIGRLLRRTSLDELPQFLNVLKGDMSVVGPRPELTHFVDRFRDEIPAYMGRHNIKSGITGWAQVNGLRGSHTSIPDRVLYDMYYLRNWNLLLDLKIILRTVVAGFSSKNAI